MSTDQNQLDLNTLRWVKSEIDTTLKQARLALELYVESPANSSQLKLVTNYIHQVCGTLQMVELYGAAMLAEELESLVSDIVDGKIKGRDDIYEIMMRAMWQLPDYLERLQSGYKDIPMVLLPLLNDLRAARHQPLLTESALFNPDLDVEIPASPIASDESLQELAKKLRHTFHLGLLDWFSNSDPKGGLKKLDSVIENLRKSANDPEVNRVLWSASGVLEALNQDGIEASVAVKLLIGQVDRQIKKIIDHGELALTKEPPAELEKNLLYYVARSSSSGKRVNELKDKFKLAEALPNAETLEQARVDLTGPNADLMQTVSTVLLDNLLQVKDGLDVLQRAENKSLSRLPALVDELKQVADTLGMLGYGKQRQTIQEQVIVLKAIASGDKALDESELMGVAQALLSVESLLQSNIVKSGGAGSGLSEELIVESQQHQIIESVMEEAQANLAKVKESLSRYIDMPRNTNLITDVPGWLDQIRGGFEILDMPRPAELITGCRDYVQTSMIDAKRSQDPAQMDALADAISSIEYYIDSVAGQWGNPDTILNVAEERLAFIGVGVEIESTDESKAVELGVNHSVNELKSRPRQGVTPHNEESMIGLDSSDSEDTSTDSVEMMDIELSDMSTTELSLADFEKTLTQQETGFEQDNTEQFDLDSSMISMDKLSEDLSFNKTEQTKNTSNEIQAIDLSSAILELDGVNEPETVIEQTEGTLNSTQDINFDRASQELDVSIDVFEGDSAIGSDRLALISTSNEIQEIKLDIDHSLERTQVNKDSSELVDIGELTLELELNEARSPKEVIPTKKLIPPVSMADIELQLAEWFQDAGNKKHSRKLQKDIKLIKQFAKETGQEDVSKIAKDMIAVIKAVQDGESSLTDDIRNILQLANITLTELFNAGVLPDIDELIADEEFNSVTSATRDSGLSEDFDDEIIEIFIEEAREEHANISRLLPVWSADTSQEASLRELRRSFHTLKGSGRLVGATNLGEFAWAFENILNRVIDHTLEPSQFMFDLLQQAADTLPGLLDLFITRGKPAQNVFVLMQQAETLSQGKDVSIEEVSEEITDHDSRDETLIIEVEDKLALAPAVDETLLDIYRKEVESHLASIQFYVDGWRDDIDRNANSKLTRAVHTLTGCSRTAAVSTLAALFGEAERYIKQLEMTNTLLSEDAVRVLIACIDFTKKTMVVLDQPGMALPDNQSLLLEIRFLHDKVLAKEAPSVSDLSVIKRQSDIGDTQQTDNSLSEYDDELFSIFIEEGTEILDESDQTLHQWSNDKLHPDHIIVMQRLLHTLKGGARLAGFTEMGDLSHSLEAMLEAIVDGQMEMSEQIFEVLMTAQDSLVNMLEQIKAKQPLAAANNIINMVDQLLGVEVVEISNVAEEPVTVSNRSRMVPDNVVSLTALTKIKKLDPVTLVKGQLLAELIPSKELVRVRSELLDNLVNFAGEVSIYRSRMEQQTNAFRYNLQELDDTVDRLREQLRKFEMEAEAQIQYRAEDSFSHSHEDFDPLEFDRFTQMQQLSRGMMESLNDLDSLRAILSGLTRESETLLVQQSRVNTELQEGLMRTRMVPFNSQANRLRRIVRQTADELGKQAELHLHGGESEIDRTVLERMLPALEHMLRNAVAHGIEMPEQRKQANKPEKGQINLDLSREGADVVLTLTDDGNGLDLATIQQKAIEKGKLKPGSHVTREALFDIILESGFSTVDEVTQIAGRGVGMDVVNNEIKQLGGLLNINTEQGNGTQFTISLPLTLSLTRALMVQVSDETYALPLLSVEGVERITTDKLQELYDQDKPVYQWLGQDYPFIHLGSVMGVSSPHVPQERSRVPLLLVRSGEYRAAVQVDNLIGSREIVVKPVGPQLSTMRGIAGATIMGDGSVVLIIDLGVLVRAISIQDARMTAAEPAPVVSQQEAYNPVVMVVDDSITVRKVTKRLLERNDYQAITAKDGMDALAQLQEMHPDILLLDVEMPRMDGFELATNMRNDDRLKDIPIIMITSRTGQKHRDRAKKIGVNFYMGKPYSEGELLDNIQILLDQ